MANREPPAGQRWCSRHKAFHDEAEFSRTDPYCRAGRREYDNARKAIADVPKARKPVKPQEPHEATEHELQMLSHGEQIVHQCPRAHHALDVLTSGWALMQKGDTGT